MMAQQISGDIGKRVQEGLKAAGRDVLIESLIDQGEGTILVIVSPIPVDVFAGKPGVGSAGQERPHDHSPSLEPCLEALARDHQSNDSRMVSFEHRWKNRRVESAGSLLYPRAVHGASAIARSLSQAGLRKDSGRLRRGWPA